MAAPNAPSDRKTSPSKAPIRAAPSSEVRNSRSSSPVRPPYSPISPARSPTRLGPSSAGLQNAAAAAHVPKPPKSQPPLKTSLPQQQAHPQARPAPHAPKTFIHTAPNTPFIPQPPPQPISLDDNPDAIALRSAITILQLQKRRAAEDIKTLQGIKARASADPEGFRDALAASQIGTQPDPLITPQNLYDDNDDDDDDEDERGAEKGDGNGAEEGDGDMEMSEQSQKWTDFPARQNVVRCPPINWNQYGVVGESLDKLHRDQQRRPTTGAPQKIGADGRVTAAESARRQEAGIAAPYTPGKDRIEKVKKGRK